MTSGRPWDSTALPDNFCIIESRESVRVRLPSMGTADLLAVRLAFLIVVCTGPQDFAKLQLDEINKNVEARRNKIFLLMEEVRRLRIQQRLKVR